MASASAGDIRPRTRPRELEDPLNYYLYHPLAARLARLLVPTGISPNLVSVGSLVALLFATWAFVGLPWPDNALAGLGFMILWHVVDGADGDLARMTGRASATGELVDGVCDYAGNVVMYFAFGFLADDTLGGWAWVLGLSAGASHVVQTNHSETQRRLYLWRAYGVPWLRTAAAEGDAVFRKEGWFNRLFGFWAEAYIWLSERMSPAANPIDEALAAADPAEAERIRALVRRSSGPSLLLEKALAGNPKTLIIAAAIALGSPVYYFLTTLVLLNLILIVSIVQHRAAARHLAASLESLRPAPPANPR
jgi:hypothetical protein